MMRTRPVTITKMETVIALTVAKTKSKTGLNLLITFLIDYDSFDSIGNNLYIASFV